MEQSQEGCTSTERRSQTKSRCEQARLVGEAGSRDGDGTATRARATTDRGTRGTSPARVDQESTTSDRSAKGDGQSDDDADRQGREHEPTKGLVDGREGIRKAVKNRQQSSTLAELELVSAELRH